MKLMYATSDKGYSLDELVCQLDHLMQEKGLPGILENRFEMLDLPNKTRII